jgi:putative heme-binding domain-containing protein
LAGIEPSKQTSFPNRTTAAGYTVENDGDSYTGLIVSENAGSVTIRQPQAIEAVVARMQIATMRASTLLLMPEGLEEALTQQDIADLLEFIVTESR